MHELSNIPIQHLFLAVPACLRSKPGGRLKQVDAVLQPDGFAPPGASFLRVRPGTAWERHAAQLVLFPTGQRRELIGRGVG